METPLPLKKATTLFEAIAQLDPRRAPRTADELDAFFVSRLDSPIDDLDILLRSVTQPQKLLFTGHRGSGKTTELAKLMQWIGDDMLVVRYSVDRTLDIYDLSYLDILLSLALQLVLQAAERDLAISPGVLDHVFAFTREITREVEVSTRDSTEAGLSLDFIAKLTTKLRTEDVTRERVRERVQPRVSDLLESIDILSRDLRTVTGRRVLFIVEDIDKADLDVAKRLFYEHGQSLSAPAVTIIYTLPTPLRHDNAFMQVRSTFSDPHILPNLTARTRAGAPDAHGLRTIQKIVTSRLAEALLTPDALERMAHLSSGIPRELIALARQAAIEALKRDRAAKRRRSDYDVLLTRAQRALLHEVRAAKDIDNTPPYRDLLHNLSVLEYRSNGEPWYDVKPARLASAR
jgi:hypothetical protein